VPACLLVLSLLLAASGVFTQQSLAKTSPSDSKAGKASKAAKRSHSKKESQKELKEQRTETAEADGDSKPAGLSEHLKKIARTVPPDGGLNSPGDASDAAFLRRAYPDKDIPLERILGARAAHENIKGRGFREDRGGEWETFGPSLALYPLTPLRNFLVRSECLSSGQPHDHAGHLIALHKGTLHGLGFAGRRRNLADAKCSG